MGYHTNFSGSFSITPALKPEHIAYLQAFNTSRRMKRDAVKAESFTDPVRLAAGLPIGPEAGYYVGAAEEDHGQVRDSAVIDYNSAPAGQPGLWCQWTVSDDGTELLWDDGEKFYDYTEWLEYLVQHFLKPWGYTVNGEVEWEGESGDDLGIIYAKDNRIQAVQSEIVTPKPVW